ncbi:MAG: hypothetical protein JRC60_07705 [Deltaproteobacteria bacterium]|nr:hypothetical protein [Deltaproteobacteria bacterium]
MGNPLTGREILVGLKKAATWRTAVACDANDGILILSESFKQTIEQIDDDSAGLAFLQRTDQGKITAGGGLEAYMRYEGLDVLLALIMGTAGVPAVQGATAAYTNSYVMANNLSGLFATLAMLKKSDKVFEYPSVKFHQFGLSGEMNAPVKITAEGIANLLELASVTNTAATSANITYPDKGNRIIMNKDAHFWFNDESGDALDSTDAIFPSGFELSFNRPMEADLKAGNEDVDEPIEESFPEITLTLNFPRYNDANDAFFTDWEAMTRKKLEIYFKGALIEETYYYEFRLSFPNLKVIDPEAAISGPGKIPVSLSFKVLATDTAPTGMTGITKPFQIDVQNKRTTDPLA